MSFVIERTVKASRKAKRCNWCDEKIQVGEPKVTVVGVWEGDFFQSNYHPECHVAAVEWWKKHGMNEDGLPDGGMVRGSVMSKDD